MWLQWDSNSASFVTDAMFSLFTQVTCCMRRQLKERLKPGPKSVVSIGWGWGFGGIKRPGEGGSEGVQNHLFRALHIHELIHKS